MTHDSIGLGEDGPTHQPVEHLAALRAIPNLNVFRPGDMVETVECWQAALASNDRPSVIALSRQALTPFRTSYVDENLCARGAYEVRAAADADVSIFASGSEVEIAVEAADHLTAQHISVRVVSVPCWERFADQPAEVRQAVIGTSRLRVAIEAGVEQGWRRFIGESGLFFGMQGFGASAPKDDLYAHFGLTSGQISREIIDALRLPAMA